MSIEKAVHERWATFAPLNALLPAARLYTGGQLGIPALPYAVLTRSQCVPLGRASGGVEYVNTTLRVRIVTADLDGAKQIKEQALRRFDRTHFALADGTCLNMQWTHNEEELQRDGMWEVSLDFMATSQHVLAT